MGGENHHPLAEGDKLRLPLAYAKLATWSRSRKRSGPFVRRNVIRRSGLISMKRSSTRATISRASFTLSPTARRPLGSGGVKIFYREVGPEDGPVVLSKE
jgi:hypothetical protein